MTNCVVGVYSLNLIDERDAVLAPDTVWYGRTKCSDRWIVRSAVETVREHLCDDASHRVGAGAKEESNILEAVRQLL